MCQGAWLATLGKAHVSFDVDCRPLTCCFGGTGLRRQVIEGSGTVFLAGGGTILRREMDKHERVVLDDHVGPQHFFCYPYWFPHLIHVYPPSPFSKGTAGVVGDCQFC